MELQVTLTLTCLIFSTALALQCYQCVPGPSGTCEDMVQDCPFQCGSTTITLNTTYGMFTNISMKSCMPESQCVNGSVRVNNQLTSTVSTECCTTDLCNTQTLPALVNQTLNGRRCYSCYGENCTLECQGGHCIKTLETVDCVGNEDRCFNVTVSVFGTTSSIAGCTTKSVCNVTAVQKMMGFSPDVRCCEGNLCNSAEILTLRFTLMFIPLLSSVLFY